MPRFLRSPLGGTVLLVFLTTASAHSQEFQVELTGRNQVSFLSDAPLEDFRGVTEKVDGFVYLPQSEGDPGTLVQDSEFYFEVDLASLDTGIGLRNRHMRENYLDTGQFPFAVFSGGIKALRPKGGDALQVTAEGSLTIHGIVRNREIDCTVSPEPSAPSLGEGEGRGGILGGSDDLRVLCLFSVSLSDHEIPIPKLMFMKIDEVMELEVDLHLRKVQEERE
jgi:polyisoprenoid-binding protein YceI